MKSLLTISDAELASLEAQERFGVIPAIGVAASSAVLAFGGMAMRFSPGDPVPVSGMDHPVGQLFLAGLLAGLMLLAAAVVRGVFMKRLQWTVLLALLVHAVICLTLNTVTVNSPLLALEAPPGDVPMEELTLPDYGGMESPQQETQQWERPTEVDLPETEQHERSEQELDLQAEPEQVQPERRVEQATTPDRRESEQRPDQRAEPEIEKQTRQPDPRDPQQVATPDVQTEQVQQPQHEARELNRVTQQLENMQRERMQVERRTSPSVSAAAIARRSDFRPQDVLRVEIEGQQRRAAQSRLADAAVEAEAVTEAVASPSRTADARSMTQQRQASAALPARSQATDSPRSAANVSINSPSISRSSQDTAAMAAAPTGGGRVALNRNQASATGGGAAAASAPQVSVSAAGQSGSPSFAASSAASGVSRSRSNIAATGRGGGGSSAPSSRLSASGLRASGSQLARSGSSSGPSMGDAIGSDAGGGTQGLSGRRGQRAAAGGSNGAASGTVGSVSVAEAGAAGNGRQFTAGGPSAAAGSQRSGIGLPAGGGAAGNQGPGGPTAGGPGAGLSGVAGLAGGPRGSRGLSGRSSDGNARLGSTAGGVGEAGSLRGTGRRAALAGLPNGSLRAEAAGELVTAGPQGGSTGSSGGGPVSRLLAGPSGGSSGRRRSGLPAGGGGPSAGSGIGRRRASLGGARSSGLGSRRAGGGSARPSISSSRQIASMIERRVPGISPIPARRLSATFSMRTPEGRAEAVAKLGGSEASESAVERGLQWLADHQFPAGNWSIHDFNCKDHECTHTGSYRADSAATGLALLAFLGAGNTHQTGTHRAVVERALNWLVQKQAANGDLFGQETEFCWLYSHGMATIALCEAYGMTKDPQLRDPAQRAVNFIVAAQHPEFGGWRYRPQFESDTSVSGWQLMALKSAEIAGLDVPPTAWKGVAHWLDTVEQSDAPGRFAYHPSKRPTPSMTAEGLLMRQYLGAQRTDSRLLAGASFLRQRTPRSDARDVYYWYYGTQVMFHLQGEFWSEWNASLRDMLVETQDKAGPDRGSWNPVEPSKDAWGESGGRLYVTCLNLLMLEVYYRHLPLYLDLSENR